MAKEIREFETDEETAKFWEEHDSSEYMEDAEWGQFEWLHAEDRCESCGGKMESKVVDIPLWEKYLTLSQVKVYHCPMCDITKLSEEGRREVIRIEKILQKKNIRELLPQKVIAA